MLETLDVPSVSIKNAICNGTIEYDKPLVFDDMEKLKKFTALPIKSNFARSVFSSSFDVASRTY